MEQFLAGGSDHSGSSSGSHTLSEGDEEKTPKVPGDGDDRASSEWNSAHTETRDHEDSEEDEDEDEKVNRAIIRGEISGENVGLVWRVESCCIQV